MKKIISLLLLSSFYSMAGFSMNESYGESGEGGHFSDSQNFDDDLSNNTNSSFYGFQQNDFSNDNDEKFTDQFDPENTSLFLNDDEQADIEDNDDEGGTRNGLGDDSTFGSDVSKMFSETENGQDNETESQEFNGTTTSNISSEQSAVALISAKIGGKQDENLRSKRKKDFQPRKLQKTTSQESLGYNLANQNWKAKMSSLDNSKYSKDVYTKNYSDFYEKNSHGFWDSFRADEANTQHVRQDSLDDNHDRKSASLQDSEQPTNVSIDSGQSSSTSATDQSFDAQWFSTHLYKPYDQSKGITDNKTDTQNDNILRDNDNQAGTLLPDARLSQEEAVVFGQQNGQTDNQAVNNRNQQEALIDGLDNKLPNEHVNQDQSTSSETIPQEINNPEEQAEAISQKFLDQTFEQVVTDLQNKKNNVKSEDQYPDNQTQQKTLFNGLSGTGNLADKMTAPKKLSLSSPMEIANIQESSKQNNQEKQLNALTQLNQSLSQQSRQFNEANKQLQKEIETLTLENQRLQKQNQQMERAEKRAKQAASTELTNQNQELKNQNALFSSQNKQLRGRLGDLQQKNAQLKEQVENFQNQIDGFKQDFQKKVTQQVAQTVSEKQAAWERQKENLEEHNRKLEAKIVQLQRKIDSLQNGTKDRNLAKSSPQNTSQYGSSYSGNDENPNHRSQNTKTKNKNQKQKKGKSHN